MMIGIPKTKEEAKKKRYNEWAGNPKGCAYNEDDCAYEVHDKASWLFYQCSRRNGYGPDKLFCKQHAKKIGKE